MVYSGKSNLEMDDYGYPYFSGKPHIVKWRFNPRPIHLGKTSFFWDRGDVAHLDIRIAWQGGFEVLELLALLLLDLVSRVAKGGPSPKGAN